MPLLIAMDSDIATYFMSTNKYRGIGGILSDSFDWEISYSPRLYPYALKHHILRESRANPLVLC